MSEAPSGGSCCIRSERTREPAPEMSASKAENSARDTSFFGVVVVASVSVPSPSVRVVRSIARPAGRSGRGAAVVTVVTPFTAILQGPWWGSPW